MATNFTPAQRSAIDERKKTLLVSAAAGSGKTAVLTERIIRSLTDKENPVDISRMLVVTFTRAAATELRTRISKALSAELALHPGDKHLTRQLMLLGSAKISTIDSFYLDIVRANCDTVGFSSSFRMADDTELVTLRKEIMNEIIDKLYVEYPDFIRIADLFSDIRSEESLGEALLELTQKLARAPEHYDVLLSAARDNETLFEDPFSTPYGKILYRNLSRMAKAGVGLAREGLRLIALEEDAEKASKKYAAFFDELNVHCSLVDEAINACDTDKVAHAAATPLAARIGSHKMTPSPALAELLTICKQFRDDWKKNALSYGAFTKKELQESGAEAALLLRLLHVALTAYDAAYKAAKKERDVAEFSDVSRAAYQLLVAKDGSPTSLARLIADSFDAVYIDEYQDVDAMQDATFRAVSKEKNRFMVGDIKQSIYGFRGAEPAVFASYRTLFPTLDEAKANDLPTAMIFMSSCFRCDKPIIDLTNTVSAYLFPQTTDDIGFTEGDLLKHDKKVDNDSYSPPPAEVYLIDTTAHEEETDTTPPEARLITARIKKLLTNGKKANGMPILPSDIAVLMRGSGLSGALASALTKAGIPVNDTADQPFFENPEVLCMYSLLAVIDNPYRDIYLAAVLRSPFFHFTLSDLVKIRSTKDRSFALFEALEEAGRSLSEGKLKSRVCRTLAKLSEYRKKAQSLPVDKLLRYLYRDTAVLSFQSGKANSSYKDNLLFLYDHARTFESSGFKGLYRFVRYIEDIMENGTKIDAKPTAQNAVSIMTIHASKGLEFPVCFIASAAAGFNAKDQQKQLIYHPSVGCGIRVPCLGAFSRANTFAREALCQQISNLQKDEEMRLLYVAMTRAREHLIITAAGAASSISAIKASATRATSPYTDYYRLCGNSYIEWILTALKDKKYSDYCTVLEYGIDDIQALEQSVSAPVSADTTENTQNEEKDARELFASRFAHQYSSDHLARIPAKLSVSRLSPTVLDVFDSDATFSEAQNKAIDTLLHTLERPPCFKGNKSLSAAERGTATHTFLQFCNFTAAEKDLDAELDRLLREKFISPEMAQAVNKKELSRFFESRFYQDLQAARALHREMRFHVFLPADQFTQDETLKKSLVGEELTVQGVIDLFYTSACGELVLCDYKTDRLPAPVLRDKSAAARFLFERHGEQLRYYEQALLQICGKKPDKTLIYSLHFGEALEMPKNN